MALKAKLSTVAWILKRHLWCSDFLGQLVIKTLVLGLGLYLADVATDVYYAYRWVSLHG